MQFLTAQLFFDLSQFAHSRLWHPNEHVWSPLHQLKKFFAEGALGTIESPVDQVHLVHSELISIGKGTVIEPGVMIQGPCIIGNECVIRHGAYIRGHTLLGDRCQIGHAAELKHSILLDDAAVTHFVYVGDSIIGNGANLGAGVKCANLRLDKTEVTVQWDGEKVKSGLKKFGAIIGDRVQIGCNSVLNPGTLIGKESICHPLLNIGGYIPPKSVIKGNRMEAVYV